MYILWLSLCQWVSSVRSFAKVGKLFFHHLFCTFLLDFSASHIKNKNYIWNKENSSWFHSLIWAIFLRFFSFISSVQFSCSVMSDSLLPHGLQHARPPCPSPTPRVYSNSCLLSLWCHPSISSSVVPFSSCLSLSQHQGLFKWWVSSLHQMAKILEFQLQHQSFQWIFRTDFL